MVWVVMVWDGLRLGILGHHGNILVIWNIHLVGHVVIHSLILSLSSPSPLLPSSPHTHWYRFTVIDQLCSTGLESAYSIYPALSRLQAAQELEDAATSTHGDRHFLGRWNCHGLTSLDVDFSFIELVLTMRSSTLKNLMSCVACDARREGQVPSMGVRRELEEFFATQASMLVSEAHLARQTKSFHVS